MPRPRSWHRHVVLLMFGSVHGTWSSLMLPTGTVSSVGHAVLLARGLPTWHRGVRVSLSMLTARWMLRLTPSAAHVAHLRNSSLRNGALPLHLICWSPSIVTRSGDAHVRAVRCAAAHATKHSAAHRAACAHIVVYRACYVCGVCVA